MSTRRIALIAALVLTAPGLAAAQTQTPPTGPTGPMTLERIHSGLAFDFGTKITEVDNRDGAFIGGDAGWMLDETFFIGGGGYWFAEDSHNHGMGYGGLVVQWLVNGRQRVGFGGKALVGGGEAKLPETFTQVVPVRGPGGRITLEPRTSTVVFEHGFFIFEPEANVFLRINRRMKILGGVSYRMVGSDFNGDSRLQGLAGTIGLQVF